MNDTYLDFWRRVIAGETAPPTMVGTMNIRLVEVDVGYARALVKADEAHLVRPGIVHGGYAATVIDTMTGLAAVTALEDGQHIGTVDLAVKLLRPIEPEVELVAAGRLLNLSSRMAASEARIEDAGGKLYAWGSATNMIIGVD